MIRRIFYILFILGFAPASSMAMSADADISIKNGLDEYSINSLAVIEAEWEKEAGRKIMENAYKEELASGAVDIMPLKAFCSVELIDDLNSKREKIKKILATALESKCFTEYDNILLKQFNKYANACISPLSKDNKSLIEEAANKTVKNDCLPGNHLNKDGNHDRNIVIFAALASVINPNSGNTKNIKKVLNNNTRLKDIFKINSNVNLNRYSLKRDKADIFSLFLYIWEDNEGKTDISNNLQLPSLNFLNNFYSCYSYPHIIQEKICHNNFKFLNKQNLYQKKPNNISGRYISKEFI